MNEQGFEPIHDAHAIEQVAIIVEFNRLLDDLSLMEAYKLSEKFKDDLPGKVEMAKQGLSIPIEKQGAVTHHPPISMGIGLRRVAPDGTVVDELRIERSSITFITTSYTRWGKIWGKASSYFKELLPIYLSNDGNLIAIGLNYADKFVWKGIPDECNPKFLIREDSKYICNHIFGTKELWHSHTGVFIRADDHTKRLLNANIDYIDDIKPEEQKKIVSIAITVTDQFNQPSYIPLDNTENQFSIIENHLNDIHDFSKSVLSELIVEKMCRRIALNEEI